MKVKQTIKLLLAGCLMLVLLLSTAPVLSESSAASDNPEQVIEQLQSSLLQVMREGEKLGYEGRYKFLE